MKLTDCLCHEFITVDLKSENADDILGEMAEVITSSVDDLDRDELVAALRTRERLGTTAMGNQFAFPHARINGFQDLVIALGISRKGVDFRALDRQPVRFFIVIVTGKKASRRYLQVLASFCSIGRDPKRRVRVLNAKDPEDLCETIKSFDISFESEQSKN